MNRQVVMRQDRAGRGRFYSVERVTGKGGQARLLLRTLSEFYLSTVLILQVSCMIVSYLFEIKSLMGFCRPG